MTPQESISTFSQTDFVKSAYHTAQHFGFVPFHTLTNPVRAQRDSVVRPRISVADRKLDSLQGALTQGVSAYLEKIYHTQKPTLFFSVEELPRIQKITLTLQVIGVKKSIAEALIIQTLRSFMTDLKHPQYLVRVNSLGDRDSVTRYLRELNTYLKRHIDELPSPAREMLKNESALATLLYLSELNHELAQRSPTPFEYLSDVSRQHFREVIEHLDLTKTPYEIDPRLIGHQHCYMDTIFAFELHDNGGVPLQDAPLTIRGGRLDAFTRHLLKQDIPAMSAVVILNKKQKPLRLPGLNRSSAPSLFVIQLGFCPRIKSLMLLEHLKRADISVYQALVSDSLSEQLHQAESIGVPFALILGQKEFVENNIIVRNMRSRSQEHVSFDALVPYLRRILKQV